MFIMKIFEKILGYFFVVVLFLSCTFSNAQIISLQDRVQILASRNAFDFFSWISKATLVKLTQSAIGTPRYLSKQEQVSLVNENIHIIREIENTSHEIDLIYSDPNITDPATTSLELRHSLEQLNNRLDAIAPLVEAVLEMQVTDVLNDLQLTSFGQPIPWVLYHVTPLPQNLVISRRDKIGAETNYILTPISTSEATDLENSVDKKLGVSSLVVNIGGLAAYPTMIMRTTALDWLTDTIAHEWIHIYLGQRPLGNNYTTPELRTMNETTASIAGGEIGKLVLQRYYPELSSTGSEQLELISHKTQLILDEFDYRAEMHTTRVRVDTLLEQGKIQEAEEYMEQRRKVFWDHGYPIRKLNQAYFAFHGSYADTPGGAAGEDPVGPAVRALRAKSPSLKSFLERIYTMTTFKELQEAIKDIQ